MLFLAEEQKNSLEHYVKSTTSAVIIKRGWAYYSGQHIKQLELTVHETVTAYVSGTDIYAVVIDLQDNHYSSCSCPDQSLCKHIVAVFFQALAEQGGGHKVAEQAYFRLLGLAKASSIVGTDSTSSGVSSAPVAAIHESKLSMDSPLQEWRKWMDLKHGEIWRLCRHSLHPLQSLLTSLKAIARQWSFAHQRLFWSYSILFTLEQAERALSLSDSFNRYYYEMSFSRMAEPWLEQFHELLTELDPQRFTPLELEWALMITNTIKRRALLPQKQLLEWDYIYLEAVSMYANVPEIQAKEKQALQDLLDGEAGEAINAAFLHMSLASFTFTAEKYNDSLELLSQADFDRAQKLIYRLTEELLAKQQHTALKEFMSYIYERIKQSRGRRAVGPFIKLCLACGEAYPANMQWSAYMAGLLPQSYPQLSEHWITQKKYEQWSNLQLLMGAKPETVVPSELKKMEKNAPELLFPMYHQSIEASILSRNRQGYRVAVKQLKKLGQLYAASRQAARWPVYVKQLTEKYQRLRAFQEELWKENIVH